MKRGLRAFVLTGAMVLLVGTSAPAQEPGIDVAQLEGLCWQNAQTQFEYDLCLMVVHSFLAPTPIGPEPVGTYTPDGPQGGAPTVAEEPTPIVVDPSASEPPSKS